MLQSSKRSWFPARAASALTLALVMFAGAAGAAKKDEALTSRPVSGTVSNAQGDAVKGAVVQLKDTKTLQIRSFITAENGSYYFHDLKTDRDYELRADFSGASSATRTLSSFDSRKQPVVNLKLGEKK